MGEPAGDALHHDVVRGFVADRYGPYATAADFAVLPGNSGRTIRFRVRDEWNRPVDELVARCAPAGVPPVGHLDLERQAGFLRAAARALIPVPEVLFAANSSPTFPTATMVTRWVPGDSTPDWVDGADGRVGLFERAAAALARVHALPVGQTPAWSELPRSPRSEIEHWSAVARRSRSDRQPWFDRLAEKLGSAKMLVSAEKLGSAPPRVGRPSVTHGDFRLGNLVVRDKQIRAVVDWELARAGPAWLDVAWLLMYLDAPWWYHGNDGGAAESVRRRVQERYLSAGGTAPESMEDAAWFGATVRFKQAAIIAYNHRLHVTGKRTDPHWERMVRAVPTLLGAAERLLG